MEAELIKVRTKMRDIHFEDIGVAAARKEAQALADSLSSKSGRLCDQFNRLQAKETKLETQIGLCAYKERNK